MKIGKLSLDDLKGLLWLADQSEQEFDDFRALLTVNLQDSYFLESHLFGWGGYYHLPPLPHVSFVLRQFGADGLFVRAALDENPIAATLAVGQMGEVARDRWLTREEADKLIAACSPHMASIVRFALATGCRASEITGLEWGRVDLQR